MNAAQTSLTARLTAIMARLVLLVLIVGATGVLLGVLFLPAALATNDVMATVRDEVLDFPPIGEADTPPQNSYVYASDGAELAELTFEENRVPVTLDQVPQVAIDAVLATEDATFYEHEGVNHLAIARAALTNFQAGGIESGASTITQQYVKMAFLSPEQTLARKIEEAVYAIQLEDTLTKDEILERYLNRSYFGNGVYGIGTAAERYFSKDISEITLGEAAMLAGLLRAPEANNPIRNIENAEDRRDIVLRQMAVHGFVTADQALAEIDRPLEVDISEPPAPNNPYWVDWVSQLLVNEGAAEALGTQTDALRAMGGSLDERRRTVFQAGLRIHTTLDPELQAEAERAIRDALLSEEPDALETALAPAAAIVSVEPGTGAIRAMALGPQDYGSCLEDGSWVDERENGELLCDRTKVNTAVPGGGSRFGRQPGSSFKPFVDAAALEDGISPGLTLDARGPAEIEDATCPTGDGEPWTVRNTGGDGIIDMYEALTRSSNVYHALLIADIGPTRVADMYERLSGWEMRDKTSCSMALGAVEVHPLSIANAYATLANRGEYCAPFPITRIEDAAGRTIWEHSVDCEQVIDTEVADRLVHMLAGPVSENGTAPVANLGEWPTRGKTGSTNDNIDAWFVGFIKQLSTAAWIGYPNSSFVFASEDQAIAYCGDRASGRECARTLNETQRLRDVTIAGRSYEQVFGGTIPAPMWADYMSSIVDRYEPEGFPDPGPIPTGQVPNLLGVSSVEEAQDLAEAAGFRLRVEEVEDYRPAGTPVGQTPDPGTDYALGAIITLQLSDGTGTPPAIPDVIGLTLDEAAELLFELGFRVFQRDVPTPDEEQDGRVIGVEPGVGTPVDPDGDVRVVLDIGVYTPEEDEDEDDDGNTDDDGDGGGGDEDEGGDDGPGGGRGNPGNGVGPPGGRDED
jgi:penicillin-binding protein 1A